MHSSQVLITIHLQQISKKYAMAQVSASGNGCYGTSYGAAMAIAKQMLNAQHGHVPCYVLY